MPQKPAPRRPNKPGPNKPGRKPPFGKGRPPARAPQRKAPPRRPAPAAKSGENDEAEDDSESSRLGERLQKVLAAAGVASRRECEELITEGRVEVDGKVVSELGARVDRSSQEIRVDGEPLPRPKLVYYAINKPTGVVTTARDPSGRPRVIDLLPPDAGRLFTVGRLDLASEGLILATNDGELANQLTHPKHGVEKTYEVQVAGQMEPDVLAQIRRGVHLSEGYAHAVHAWIKAKLKRSTLLEMVLDEGRNREVRRLLARVGHKVQRLTRIAVGPIRLGELPRGAVRKLTPDEVRKLREAAAAGPKPAREAPPAARSSSGSARPPRPASARPATGRPAGARSVVSKRPPTKKPALRKPPVTSAPPATDDDQTFQRKIVGDDGSGLVGPRPGRPAAGKPAGKPAGRPGGTGRGKPAGGRPAGGKPVGGRAAGGGKPDFRKTKGTKLTGRKPVKRRRPERPQRGPNSRGPNANGGSTT